MDREKIIKIVADNKQELKKRFGVEKIGLFGSYARGEENPASDIDFVVELRDPDLFMLIAIKNYLREILDSEVDIVRYRQRMNDFLKKRILKDTIYV